MEPVAPERRPVLQRHAYAMLLAVAAVMGVLAVVCSRELGYPLRDPEGLLGPAWLRLPLLVGMAFLVDVVPRSFYRTRGRLTGFTDAARGVIREHWTRERLKLVTIGLIGFYITYVSYRNLKNFLPFIMSDDGEPRKYDRELHKMDEWLLFGNDLSTILHSALGTGISAHILSYIYVFFLPMVPISIVIWSVWSRNISYGYWFVTAQCLCWSLGTLSYYALPTLGPNFYYPSLYTDLPHTAVKDLQDALSDGRQAKLLDPFSDGIQSVAGFASLHVAITVCVALVAHYTIQTRWLRIGLWTFAGLTVTATTYFGWHYIADDIAGLLIAVVSVYLAGLATGQKFERQGRSSHPTTDTAEVPIEEPSADELKRLHK